MPRYIKVEDAIKVADYECGEFRGIFGQIKERLEALPTADVVEVVRCKKCGIRLKDGYCPNGRFTPHDDWFCADGERREDNAEVH